MSRILKYFIIVGLATLPHAASAQDGFPAPTHDAILWSAKACYAEALWSKADCSALLHVIRKRSTRFGWPFLKMLREYSVVNWIHSNQGKKVKNFKLGEDKNSKKDWNNSWKQLVTYVVDVLQGRVEDPCPIANHWAAPWYKPKSPMRKVRCQIHTDNQFWVSK